MQEGRTDVLSRLKREKVLEIQRTRGEKKRDEWRRTEECAGRVDERRREEERIDEREREENRGLVAAQTRSIRPLPPTSPPPPLPRRARSRTERGTWFLRECTDTQRDLPILFSELTCLSFSLSLLLFPRSRRIRLSIFSPLALSTIRHFERERASHPPSTGRFPHDEFGTYLLSFLS